MQDNDPLIVAAEAGDLARVTELLAARPDAVNVRGWMGITPLIAAVWHADDAGMVRLLLERGADPHAVRTYGDSALHWAASGEVAALLAAAAGPRGLAARYLRGRTPLHVAVEKERAGVVGAFVDAGADLAAVDDHGDMPLDLADTPDVARVLVAAGAPLRTRQPSTPLHNASRRVARAPEWVSVVEDMLARGADPALRDEFGALPADLAGDSPVRARLVEADLTVEDAAAGAHGHVVLHPSSPRALTTMYSGTVVVRWRLAPSVAPVEVVRVGRRRRIWGSYDAPVFSDQESVWLRDWARPARAREIPADLLPEDLVPNPVLSPDGRYLAAAGAECVRLIDLSRGVVAGELHGFGDWSVVPRFAPDGRTIVVGNSMQGTCWLTALEIADGTLRRRYQREDLPTTHRPEVVGDVAFTRDGRLFATRIRPDGAGDALVVVSRTDTGDTVWARRLEAAALCFAGDRLALAQSSGVLWLDAATGAPVAENRTLGRVNALAANDFLVAATDRGLHRVS